MECHGRADASKGAFRIDFRPAGHEEDPRFERRDDNIHRDDRRFAGRAISTTEVGIGRYNSRATNAIVNQARIQLGTNGGATLAFSGRDTYSFTGTWAPVREGIAQVDITRMQGRIAVTGRATVQHRGNRVTSVQLSGSSRQRGRYQLSFTTAGEDQRQPPIRRSWKFRLGDLF